MGKQDTFIEEFVDDLINNFCHNIRQDI